MYSTHSVVKVCVVLGTTKYVQAHSSQKLFIISKYVLLNKYCVHNAIIYLADTIHYKYIWIYVTVV